MNTKTIKLTSSASPTVSCASLSVYPIITALLSAAIFGNGSSIMMRVYLGSDEYHDKTQSIEEFINFHHLPKNLASRLQESFKHTSAYTNEIDMNTVSKSFPESACGYLPSSQSESAKQLPRLPESLGR
ncbi:hypothetical protein DPMN_002679 [Dreissena polymorpha]|uniref:Uncharacterized protein n=1 Tax=Dreissena polymorpha TaxID=45954 RepID=A0A9D4MK66_DREPO|nr:hypothetical protein DPMN_002679 [Dreissena polymorpha]